MSKKWFVTKTYGWGWVPATWQGWAVTALYIVFITWDGARLESAASPMSNVFPFVARVFLATIILLGICFLTGEKPRWRWGTK